MDFLALGEIGRGIEDFVYKHATLCDGAVC